MLVQFIAIVWVIGAVVGEQHVISTAQGKLRGMSQDEFVSYEGIPYASITSPAERFKGAGLAPFWSGIRESEERHCSASSSVAECLNLDVHVPHPVSGSLPVLVWVKGGSGGSYHPGKLVQQGIIVVLVNHRTGPIGFLCFHNEKVPGNAGAKDVVLALRWVRDNIVAFNGDPNRVVVAGQGFGAAIVEALLVSPMGRHLYHGAILQSGSFLSPWAFNYDAKERTLALAEMISNSKTTKDLTSVLHNAKTEHLVSKSDKLDKPYFPFGMCIEKSFKNEEQLIAEAPNELLKKKGTPVPVITGYNSDEAYIFLTILEQVNLVKSLEGDVAFVVPEELYFYNERESQQVVRQLRNMYFINNFTMAAFLAYHRDAYFMNHVHRSALRHSSRSHFPVYYYQFAHVGDVGVTSQPGIEKTGAAHSDELAYLFPEMGRSLEGSDGHVQQHLVRMWTNFVKHLNPTPLQDGKPQWEAMKATEPRILDIKEEVQMMDFPFKKEARMWDDIYDRFYYNRHRNNVA